MLSSLGGIFRRSLSMRHLKSRKRACLIKRSPDIRPSEITPKDLYLNRRNFLAGLPLAGVAFLARAALADNKP
jgi:hypothetical protein